MNKKWNRYVFGVAALIFAIGVLYSFQYVTAEEEVVVVEPKSDTVQKNDDIDHDNENIQKVAVTYAVSGEYVISNTPVLQPPNKETTKFVLFPNWWYWGWDKATQPWKWKWRQTYVDIEHNTGDLSPTRWIDENTEIKVQTVSQLDNAGQFRLRAEGNLCPPGDGGSLPHWSVKPKEPEVVLKVNGSSATADDNVAYGNNGATLTVELKGGIYGTQYQVTLTDSGNGTPSGDVSVSSASVTLTGPLDSKTVNLNGLVLGGVTITGTCSNAEDDTVDATVVDVDHIEVFAEGSWHEKDSIVILRGTKYTFKAVLPPGATWPSGKPVWSGASGTGETIEVTFPTSGACIPLTATCGSGNSVSIDLDVIVPEIDVLLSVSSGSTATSYSMSDGYGIWRKNRSGQAGMHDPFCFKKGGKTALKMMAYHPSKVLTFKTPVSIKGDVSSWDHYITGDDYTGEISFAKDSWEVLSEAILSAGNTSNFVDYDNDTDIAWYYKVTWGTDTWRPLGDSDGLKYRIVWDARKEGKPHIRAEAFGYEHYTKEHIKDACEWGWDDGATTANKLADKVCNSVHRSGVYDTVDYTVSNCWGIHSTSTGHCATLATELVYVMRCLGVEMNTAFANLRPAVDTIGYTRTLPNGHRQFSSSGLGKCEAHQLIVSKSGDSLFSSNNWQGCAYMSIASPARDTICWDVQHNKHHLKYWQLGNDKSDPADAPCGRFGVLYSYNWRAWGVAGQGGGGDFQQVIEGDNHNSCTITFPAEPVDVKIEGIWYKYVYFEYHGN